MIILEVVFYNVNSFVINEYLSVSDVGGSLVIHAFGAYFGLTVARAIYKEGQIGQSSEVTNSQKPVFYKIFGNSGQRVPFGCLFDDRHRFPVDVLAFVQFSSGGRSGS